MNADGAVEFDLALIDRLISVARSLGPAIKPAMDDCGHEFYFFWSDRGRLIQNLSVGWTYKAHTVGGGRACLFEPCPVEELDNEHDFKCAYWYED